MNKRGFIFTFISVILVSVILLAFLIQYTSRTKVEIEKTNTEIETMNSFVKSLNNDYLPRALKISGNQAILALLNFTGNRERYIGDPEGEEGEETWDIQHVIINAIVDGEYENGFGQGDHGTPLKLMVSGGLSYKLNDTLEEIKNLGNTTGITVIIDNIQENKNRMEVYQISPWYVNVNMTISYSISNKNEDVKWEYKNEEIMASIPIFNNFVDPIYMIADGPGDDKGVLITVNKTMYALPTNIELHVQNTNFLACNQAPSFLQRMQGITNPDEFGIESLVNVQDSQQSAIDYQYIGIARDLGELIEIPDNSEYYIDRRHQECYGFGFEVGGGGGEG